MACLLPENLRVAKASSSRWQSVPYTLFHGVPSPLFHVRQRPPVQLRPAGATLGDVNGDDQLTLADLVQVKLYASTAYSVLELQESLTANQQRWLDANQDGDLQDVGNEIAYHKLMSGASLDVFQPLRCPSSLEPQLDLRVASYGRNQFPVSRSAVAEVRILGEEGPVMTTWNVTRGAKLGPEAFALTRLDDANVLAVAPETEWDPRYRHLEVAYVTYKDDVADAATSMSYATSSLSQNGHSPPAFRASQRCTRPLILRFRGRCDSSFGNLTCVAL